MINTEEIEFSLNFFTDFYKSALQIFALNPSKGKFCVFSCSTFSKLHVDKIVNLVNRQENILFLPVENKNVIFLDDIYIIDADMNEFPTDSAFVRTSKFNWQAHIKISNKTIKCLAERGYTLQDIQNRVIIATGADKAASSIKHLRRLPGTLNFKYVPPEYVVFENNYFSCSAHEFENWIFSLFSNNEAVIADYYKFKQPVMRKIKKQKQKKSWIDFHDNNDESRTDIKYALHLIWLGYSRNEIYEALKKESLNLEERKKGHVEDYLQRTVSKAYKFFSQSRNIKS